LRVLIVRLLPYNVIVGCTDPVGVFDVHVVCGVQGSGFRVLIVMVLGPGFS